MIAPWALVCDRCGHRVRVPHFAAMGQALGAAQWAILAMRAHTCAPTRSRFRELLARWRVWP